MEHIARPVRIDPAFEDREHVRSLFYQCAPYPVLGVYVPDGVQDADSTPSGGVMPWFRGNLAIGGQARYAGVESVLWNPHFLEAAKLAFGTPIVRPKTVVVNLTTPMPAGAPHVDIPSFYGATREHYPIRFLAAMGESRLFERWRVVEAGAISWFYDGAGGAFDYWPDGLAGEMLTERPPFANVAIVADNDRMFHRIGEVGAPNSKSPSIGVGARIRPSETGDWIIEDGGRDAANFPAGQVRLSVLWKAEVFADEAAERQAVASALSLDQVMSMFLDDLRRRRLNFVEPSDPLSSEDWLSTLRGAYYQSSSGGRL